MNATLSPFAAQVLAAVAETQAPVRPSGVVATYVDRVAYAVQKPNATVARALKRLEETGHVRSVGLAGLDVPGYVVVEETAPAEATIAERLALLALTATTPRTPAEMKRTMTGAPPVDTIRSLVARLIAKGLAEVAPGESSGATAYVRTVAGDDALRAAGFTPEPRTDPVAALSAILTDGTVREVRSRLYDIEPQDAPLVEGGPTVRRVRKALFDIEAQDAPLTDDDLAAILATYAGAAGLAASFARVTGSVGATYVEDRRNADGTLTETYRETYGETKAPEVARLTGDLTTVRSTPDFIEYRFEVDGSPRYIEVPRHLAGLLGTLLLSEADKA